MPSGGQSTKQRIKLFLKNLRIGGVPNFSVTPDLKLASDDSSNCYKSDCYNGNSYQLIRVSVSSDYYKS